MKAAFYQCITYYFLGRRSQELEKSGECLAYYTAARDELARATQLAKVRLVTIFWKTIA